MERWILKGGLYRTYMERFSVNPLLAKILSARVAPEETEDFLDREGKLSDPFLLPDMDKAAALLQKHLEAGSTIRIVGDYDVDGVTSSAILYLGLKALGARVDCRIPERIGEGYGFCASIAEEIIRDGIQLVLTCDHGIRETDRAAFLKEHGVDLIITDHHEVEIGPEGEDVLPDAGAVINPHRKDSVYPYPQICGAAVAYQLIRGLRKKLGLLEQDKRLLGYAALGTVCDVMPLQGENRRLVSQGFSYLNEQPGPGIRALLEASGTGKLTPYTAGFVIGPMLNAGGRLGSQNRYLPILISEDEGLCRQLAAELWQMNRERQQMTEEGIREGMRQLEQKEAGQLVKVLYLPELHESIAGLVAGKIKERTHCPVYVLTRGEEGLKGSGRSIPPYRMFEEMCKVSDLFSKFGGHPMAAGFSLAAEPGKEEEAVREMERRLNEVSTLTEKDCAEEVYIDAAVRMQDLSVPVIRSLEILEPCGTGNPRPLLAQKSLLLKRGRWLGQNHKALKLTLVSGNTASEALLFRTELLLDLLTEPEKELLEKGQYWPEPRTVDVCYQAEIDTYRSEPSPKFIIQHMREVPGDFAQIK